MTSKRKLADLEQASRDRDLHAVMSTPEGRAFVWRMITAVAKVFLDAFDLNDRQESYNLGAQSVGRALIANCQRVCPKEYLLMVQQMTNADLLNIERAEKAAAEDAAASS